MDEYSAALIEAVGAAVGGWVERSVERIASEFFGTVPDDLGREARAAGQRARVELVGELRALLDRDVDDQPTTPLAIMRAGVRYPTAVLAAAGVPAVERDEMLERSFPADRYDLSPASWRDIDESLHEPGLRWGAWKAHTVLARRRPG